MKRFKRSPKPVVEIQMQNKGFDFWPVIDVIAVMTTAAFLLWWYSH